MKKIIKNITAYTLVMVLAVTTFAFSGGVKTVEAASKSVDVVATEKNNSGDTIKYSYNKKGLVSKMVSKNSWKDKDSDVSETTTTTFKYNKKNKVAKKTEKAVTKTKYYEMDKTTGMKIVGTRGTVTDTTTTVTTYKYNKKGLAKSSVATTTYGKSGTLKNTDKSAIVEDATELSDGRVIAGYNDRKPDGTYYSDKENAQKAYYYSGSIALTEGTTVTTTSYKNGKGKYTVTTTSSYTGSGYKTEPVTTYYGRYNGTVVTLTKGDFTDADGYHWNYQRPDGTLTDSFDFSRIEQKNIVADPTATNQNTTVSTTTYSPKSVTTTKYSYDKKKRVKKEVATTVVKNNSVDSDSYSSVESSTSEGSSSGSTTSHSRKYDSASKSESTREHTSVTTTTYTYDKKGRVKKQISKDDGKENSKEVEASMTVSKNEEESWTTTYSDGRAPETRTAIHNTSCSAYPTTTTTTVVKGVETTTVTSNPYTETYTTKDRYSDETTTGTREYVTYANGGRKTTNTYTTNSNNPTEPYTETGTEISYRFDEDGKSTGFVDTYTSTNNTVPKTYASYTDATGTISGSVEPGVVNDGATATQKIDAAKAALEASGTPFNKITTKTAPATPSKATTTYSYDKKGNVKVANTKGTYTDIVNVKNETYGNTIYEFDANGELCAKERAVTHKYTDKGTKENTVKDGTNSLTKVLLMNKSTRDRIKGKGYGLTGRVTYKIKKKKSSVATLAKKQQWILQNGRLNGIVGLD